MYELVTFILLVTIVYLPYKWRTFVGVSWLRVLVQCALFIIGSGLLLFSNIHSIPLVFSPLIVSLLLLITIIWFSMPWYVRRFGTKPEEYIKRHPFQFVVRFEYRVMIMKYFEIIFQQAQLLYVMFVLFGSIQNTFYKLLSFFSFVIFVHYINIYLMPDRKAAIFWLKASIPMGLVFGPLLLSGHVLVTTSIHLLAYLFYVSYWMPNMKKLRLI